MNVLAGDVGGTHARLVLADVTGPQVHLGAEAEYPSHDYPDLASIVRTFLRDQGARPERACFGVAGPIRGRELHPTNLPWTIRLDTLAERIGIAHATVINDFDAIGHAVPYLAREDLRTLQEGNPLAHGPIAVIGAGTGLGEGLLVWDGDAYRVHSSEGGHADFAAQTAVEWELRGFLEARYGHVSYERVVSGEGLVDTYHFLETRTGAAAPDHSLLAEMARGDPAAVISRHALRGDDQRCAAALDLFVTTFGAQAGNLALTVGATGGVYIGGGIAPQIIAKLEDGSFLRAFRAKGRLSDFVNALPVHVIVNPNVGMLGAAHAAARRPEIQGAPV